MITRVRQTIDGMSRPLSLLIVEDSEDDLFLVTRELERGGFDLSYERVETAAGFTAALAGVDRRLLAASASLGASGWRTFWRITFPLALPGIVTGFALSFAHTLGEFGVVLMLGGNIPGRTQTASIAIYDNVQIMDYAAAGRQSLMLLGMSFTLLVLINALNRSNSWRLR